MSEDIEELKERARIIRGALPRGEGVTPLEVTAECIEWAAGEIERLRSALEPFADIGRPLIKACETGAIPNGASARFLKLDPLVANDFARAATVFDAKA